MQLSISLQVREIVFDIQNKTFLTGRSREAEANKNFEAASTMQASDDDENSYQIHRSISTAFSQMKTALAEYLSDTTTTADNLIEDEIDNNGTLTLALNMPSNFNQSSTDNLTSSLHNYIVCSAIADWFTITNKEDASGYTDMAQKHLDNARRAMFKRKRPARPSYTNSSE